MLLSVTCVFALQNTSKIYLRISRMKTECIKCINEYNTSKG